MDELDLSALEKHPKDSVKLFKMMMRFEYAIKETCFTITNRKGFVSVDWNRFANERLTSSFYEKVKCKNLADTLIAEPPSHQCELNGSLFFKAANSPSNVQDLIGALCRVRNNLFHGGKSGYKDQDRNDELIDDAIKLIIEAINSCDEVKAAFEGRF